MFDLLVIKLFADVAFVTSAPKFINILRKLTTLCRGPASIHSLLNDTNLFQLFSHP